MAEPALVQAAECSGLDPRGARLIRLYGTAVYHLPATGAVARIAPVTSRETVNRLATSVAVTRRLTETGLPAVRPLLVEQPVTSHGCASRSGDTFPSGPQPVPADLGHLLRRLHQLGLPPVSLPA